MCTQELLPVRIVNVPNDNVGTQTARFMPSTTSQVSVTEQAVSCQAYKPAYEFRQPLRVAMDGASCLAGVANNMLQLQHITRRTLGYGLAFVHGGHGDVLTPPGGSLGGGSCLPRLWSVIHYTLVTRGKHRYRNREQTRHGHGHETCAALRYGQCKLNPGRLSS